MAYVYPTGTLKILHNINLNNDYDHTIYFETKGAQTAYFMGQGKVKYTLNNQSYQRKERGWLQVNKHQMDLLDCTYIMFQTTSSSRWFYAFITSVEYVNEGVSRIQFEIDVIQTWMFDENNNGCKWVLDACFVEREHTDSDKLFEHTVPEDLDIGDYYIADHMEMKVLEPTCIVVLVMNEFEYLGDPTDNTLVAPTPQRIGDYEIGIGIHGFRLDIAQEASAFEYFVNRYISAGYEDSILQIYQVPEFLYKTLSNVTSQTGYETLSFDITPNFTYIGGYQPKNKKLFCYPYNFIRLINNVGDEAIFKHELWLEAYRGQFNIVGTGLGTSAVMCYPYNYKNLSNTYDEGLVLSDFPENAWVGDSWQVWLAKNGTRLKTQIAGGIGATVLGGGAALLGLSYLQPALVAGGVRTAGGGLVAIATTVSSYIAKKKEIEAQPHQSHGQFANNLLNTELGICGYRLFQMTIKKEFAVIIDEYFSRFGYACHEVKVPNIHARDNWTFTKTVGCEINGNIPSDDANKIKAIFDHGVTFWSSGDNIGNYGDFTNGIYTPNTPV